MKMCNQKGASMVEFTIIIPVLFMFIFLVYEMGILFYTLNALNKTAQDAARYMSQQKSEFAIRKPVAENLLRYGNVTGTAPPLLPNGDTLIVSSITDSGTHVSVTVSYQHDLITGTVLGVFTGLSTRGAVGFGDTFNLSSASIMRFAQ